MNIVFQTSWHYFGILYKGLKAVELDMEQKHIMMKIYAQMKSYEVLKGVEILLSQLHTSLVSKEFTNVLHILYQISLFKNPDGFEYELSRLKAAVQSIVSQQVM